MRWEKIKAKFKKKEKERRKKELAHACSLFHWQVTWHVVRFRLPSPSLSTMMLLNSLCGLQIFFTTARLCVLASALSLNLESVYIPFGPSTGIAQRYCFFGRIFWSVSGACHVLSTGRSVSLMPQVSVGMSSTSKPGDSLAILIHAWRLFWPNFAPSCHSNRNIFSFVVL